MVLRRKCHTNAAGQKPSLKPASSIRQQISTSSPAAVNCGSKPPIFEQRRLAEDHVAARQMLGAILGDQHVAGRTWRRGAAGLDPAVFMRRVVGSAASVEILFDDRAHHQRQPMRIDDAIGIGVGDDFAARRVHPDVARDAEALVGLADQPELGKVHRDFRGTIARAVIDDDDFEIGIIELAQRLEARAHRALRVVRADDDRHHRHRRRMRRAGAIERDERHHVGRAHQLHAEPVFGNRSRNRRCNHPSRPRTKRHCNRFVLPRRCVREFDHDRTGFREVVQGNYEVTNFNRLERWDFTVEKIFFQYRKCTRLRTHLDSDDRLRARDPLMMLMMLRSRRRAFSRPAARN